MSVYDFQLSDGGDLILDTICEPVVLGRDDAIRQQVKQALKLWKGNYPRDLERGVDWPLILTKNVNRNAIYQLITEALLKLEFVSEVLDVFIETKSNRQSVITYVIIVDGEIFNASEDV